MANLRDAIKRRKQMGNRMAAVGLSGVQHQDKRAKAAGPANAGREAIKRVGEYKRGKIDKSDGTNSYVNRRSQENLK